MASKRWCNERTRQLLGKLRISETRRNRWNSMDASEVLCDMNAALEASWFYDAQSPAPGILWMSHEAYMLMTGHTKVKMGRRKFVWKKALNVVT
jgi:hypothetical protein